MKTQFTPGPWHIKPEHPYRIHGHNKDAPYSVVIAETCGYKLMRERNAALIAAAPDMFEALQELLKQIGAWFPGSIPAQLAGAAEQARTALQKANGGE